ncbi:MAG: hypothetical protein EZS28_030642 [Streblomastix strix]|uniref:Uncharacterized protein n=1 Tax=Streblomastix strix TaxID=222440 RepID=A0A5J4UUH0_9EUKA|nr:MAG: hypothetical protein EZS28_030642 [Streblomastix strix]
MAANERLKKHEFCSSRKNVVVPTNSYGIRAAHAKLWHDFITVHTLDSSENTGSTGQLIDSCESIKSDTMIQSKEIVAYVESEMKKDDKPSVIVQHEYQKSLTQAGIQREKDKEQVANVAIQSQVQT